MADSNLKVKIGLDQTGLIEDLRALSRAFAECANHIEGYAKGRGEPGVHVWISGGNDRAVEELINALKSVV